MMNFNFFLVLLIIAVSPFALAKEMTIKARAYLDVEKGRLVKNKYIIIDHGKIVRISSRKGKGELINLSDSVLLPGLIDCHTHLFFTQTLKDKNLESALEREARLSGEFRKIRAKVFMQQYLKEGFTALCDLGNSDHFLDVDLKREIKNKSDFPLLFVSGPGLATNRAQFFKTSDLSLVKKEYSIVGPQSDIGSLIDLYLKNDVDILKVYLDNSPGEGTMDKETLRKILSSPRIIEFKKVTFHAIEPETRSMLRDFNIKSTEHFNFFSKSDLPAPHLKFTTLTNLDEETLKEFGAFNKVQYLSMLTASREAFKKKVTLVFGPDFYFHSPTSNFNRAKYVKRTVLAWSEAGIPPLEIIRAMTINAARSIKMSNKIGSIGPGKEASFIAVKNDPQKEISTLLDVQFVMNRGVIIH